jgi:hypothetical protein
MIDFLFSIFYFLLLYTIYKHVVRASPGSYLTDLSFRERFGVSGNSSLWLKAGALEPVANQRSKIKNQKFQPSGMGT